MNPDELRRKDHAHLWHPYTDIATYEAAPHRCIVRAEGVHLYQADGRALLDGISSWWSVALGHGHPRVVEAIQRQAATLQHCILATLAHPPIIELAARLVDTLPAPLRHAYFAADGSSAVDAALKMARQYWIFRGEPGRVNFVALENAYHGDSLGAMGVGLMEWFRGPYADLVRPAWFTPSPHLPGAVDDPAREARRVRESLAALEAHLAEHADTTAAVIVEPLCQAAAGIRIYPAEYLGGLRALCDRHRVLLIADEIATGLGRTGTWLACDQAGIVPDIVCLGKALTAGYLPLSAAVATAEVYDAFRAAPGEKRVFWDGHTFCGNPITAAAALAALDVFREEDVVARAQPRMRRLAEIFAGLATLPGVADHRSLGMIGMCAVQEDAGGAATAARAAARALELGLFTRPLGEVLYLWPPLSSTAEEIDAMGALLGQALRESL
jgi:adenosylmethionine-8-amino-7-oxononanoate aminotransferase